MTLVLASRSPQRREILRQLGVEFVERPVDVVEEDDGAPEVVAGENALRKAVAAGAGEGEIVLGVDTLVATELEIWGKPPNAAAAAETLRRLSGRTHRVVSGVALLRATGDVQAATASTDVTFRAIDDALLEWYVGCGEWEGRAGLDPRRLRARDRPEHGPRIGLQRVGRARSGAVLPRLAVAPA